MALDARKPDPPASGGSQAPDTTDATREDVEPELVGKASELLRPLLKDPKQAPRALAMVVSVVESYSGPIPHPKHLAGIDAIVPGGAREMLDMVHIEQQHRHRMNTLEIVYPYLGLLAGFLLALACIGGAVFLAMHNQREIAGALMGIPAFGVIGYFINARVRQSKAAVAPQAPRVSTKRRGGR